MANTFITPDIVARESLMVLENNLLSSSVMSSSVASEFTGAKVGDTVKVRRPAFFAVDDYNMNHGTNTIMQTAKETSTNVVIEKLFDVSFEVTNTEMTLKVDQFRDRLLVPAMAALSQKIDTYAFGKVNGLGGTVFHNGPADVTPLDTLAHVAEVAEKMNIQQVPMTGRKWVVSPQQQTQLYKIAEFVRSDIRGGGASPVLEAQLGRFMGLDVVMSQNLPKQSDVATADGVCALTAVASVGDSTIAVGSGTGSQVIKKGTTLSIAYLDGITRDHKATADATMANGACDVNITPPIYGHDEVVAHATQQYATSATAAVTIQAHTSDQSWTTSAAFVPDAFQMVFVPQADPMGPGTSSATVSYNGMSLRVLQTYDHKLKKDMVSIDCLVGAACVDGRLGVTTTG